ncbi:MAG: DNA-processing protein DprA, partial [Candidatus Portnoybacteria bacterium]|nr:DNA-processing protein DprA [Candidatus Portnoybacteria bacterium]
MHKSAKYFVAFNQFHERIGPQRIKRLLNYFPDLESAWRADSGELIAAGLEENLAQEFCAGRISINPEAEMEKLAKENIGVITILDENYPGLLKEIYDPPALIYVKGSLLPQDDQALAIVGTRLPSPYGQQAASFLAGQIAQLNLTIISGLARGVDTLAHLAALQNNSRTIAVIGSGL